MRASTQFIIWLCLTVVLAGCGGGQRKAAESVNTVLPGAAEQPAISLPAPSALPILPRQSSASDPLQRLGKDFEAILPNTGVSASGLGAIFSGAGATFGDSAYAIYSFDTQDYTGAAEFIPSWAKAPGGAANAWLGIANFERDAWEWHNISGGVSVRLSTLSAHTSGTGKTLAAVVLAAQDSAELALLQIGAGSGYDEIEDNDDVDQIQQTLEIDPNKVFVGSLGRGPYETGPDGDTDDYYAINANVGDWVTVWVFADYISCPGLVAGLSTAREAPFGLPAAGSITPIEIGRQPVQDAADLPLRLQISSFNGGYTKYAIVVTVDTSFNELPLPSLTLTNSSGAAPLTVDFDASTSYDDDGTIASYAWDWDGDLVFDEDSGNDPTVSHTYSTPGVYRAIVKVTDNEGGVGINIAQNAYPRGSGTVTVGDPGYDEREDNDDAYLDQEYNPLPAMPFSGYTGNVGPAPQGIGYDGDTQDQFKFNALSGEKWTFIADFDPVPTGLEYPPGLQVTRTNFGNLGLHNSETRCFVGVLFDATDTYHLSFNSPILRDYELSVISGLPPQAVTLSIDSADRGPIPFSVDFSATATDGIGALTKYEWDFDGDGVFEADTGGNASTSHTYTSAGIFKPKVRITDAGGFYGDSDGMSTIYAWPVAYDEVEDNEDPEQSLSVYPVSDFNGNIGLAGLYDGDFVDNFSFDGFAAGQSIHVTVNLSGPDAEKAGCFLYNGSGNTLVVTDIGSATRELRYSIKPTDMLPIKLRLVLYEEDEEFNPLLLSADYSFDVDAPNDTPVPVLTAPLLTGPAPLIVDLDGSGSSDSDGIAKYEFDLNNDNTWLDNGGDATLSHTFTDPGSYVVRLRVTDTLGNVSNSLAFVHAVAGSGFYDEVENNDDWMVPQPLPAFPVSDFRGSIGMAAGYTATDGDNDDFFGFSGTAGQTLTLDIRSNGQFTDALIWLYSTSSGYVGAQAASKEEGATVQLQEVLPDTGSYYIWVQAFAPGFGDYSFDATLD